MKNARKSIAFLLTLVMLFSTLPISVFAVELENDVAQSDIVGYNLGSREVSVGSDEKQLEAGTVQKLFDADGSFTIELEPNAFFPYEVQFTCDGETWEEWFMTPEDSVVIGGHEFFTHSKRTDPTMPTQIGLWVGGEYIPSYPQEKTFTKRPLLKSMMPLQEKHFNLDMTGHLPEELKEVEVSTILNSLTTGTTTGTENIAAWAKWYYYDEDGNYVSSNDNYTVLQTGGTVDLTDYYRWDSDWFYLELIIGTADQLDLSNVRYIVQVKVDGASKLLQFKAATEDHTPIEIYQYSRGTWTFDGVEHELYYLDVNKADWQYGQNAYVGIYNSSLDTRYNVVVLKGYYETYEAATADPTAYEQAKITDQIWTEDLTTKGYFGDYNNRDQMITVLFLNKTDGTPVKVMPMVLRMDEAAMSLSYSSSLYADSEGIYRDDVDYASSSQWDSQRGYSSRTIYLQGGYAANGTYYCNLWMYNEKGESGSGSYGLEFVKKAVVGYYATEDAIPGGAADIKAQLFSNAYQSGGYDADYSRGVVFTIVDVKGGMHWFALQTKAYEEYQGGTPSEPSPASSDTYFRMNSAAEGVTRDGYIDSYTMPYDADSYYYNGYQTVLLLNHDSGYGPVTDATIIPSFYQGYKVQVYAGHDGASGTKQVSGETAIPFESGKAIQYSAAAENGTSLKNYWVTFLTQQSGPKLFVNATNDESHYVKVNEGTPQEKTIPQREVFLTDEFDNHHDVFFANIGDAPITGLYVKLEDAQNVALDEYWTIGATKTLSAFTTTSRTTSYGELANTAKIRLVPAKDSDGNAKYGPISGTLVIGYTGGKEVRINLTGIAGTPKITTETIVDGVKYVPYSSVIQTNNMHSDNVAFSLISGNLPSGMSLKPNGELYGIPTATGTYTFTVQATYTGSAYTGELKDSKEFTLLIKDNTDENVEAANTGDQGYALLNAVDRQLDVSQLTDGKVFRSNGIYGDFVAFYLDGRKLVEGTDFDSEEGSTKITIRSQTFKNAGNGQHTIAAEFRAGKDPDGEMKRTAQNVTVSGAPSSSRGSGSASTTYKVTAPQTVGGKVTVTPENAAAGKTVTVKVMPDIGYKLGELTVGDVKLTKVDENTYTFTMPKSKVEIKAAFEKIVSANTTFADIEESAWYFEAARYVYENGLMRGVTEDSFAPEGMMTRAMLLTVLSRYAGAELETTGADWYVQSVEWAKANGISDGLNPEENITREQVATMLYRYAGEPETVVDLSVFSDENSISDYAVKAMQWAVANGLINGMDGKLAPQAFATRAQLAAIIMRYCENVAK